MTISEFVAAALASAGVADVYTVPPSALECAEPVVCGLAVIEQIAHARGHERCRAKVEVRAVRLDPHEGFETARACELALRKADWKDTGRGRARVCGLDCTMPEFVCVDSSGRYVWRVVAEVTVEVEEVKEGA